MVLAVPLYGIALAFLFCATHECVHRTAFRTRGLNDAVAAVAGATLLLPSRWFRFFHAGHHRDTQDPDRDPELSGWQPTTRSGLIAQQLGLAYWRSMGGVVARLARGRSGGPFVPRGHQQGVVREARVLVIAYATIAVASVVSGSWLAVQLWILPALAGQPFLRGYLLAEHTGCPQIPDD